MGVAGKGFMTTAIAFDYPDNTQEIVFCGFNFFFFLVWTVSIPRATRHDFPPHPIHTAHPLNQNSAIFAVISKMTGRLKQERGLPAREQQWQVSWEQRVA